jgi:transposase
MLLIAHQNWDELLITVNDIDTDEALENIKKLLSEGKNISPALNAAFDGMILLVTVLVNCLGLNSRNSSKPPSSDYGANEKKGKGKSKDSKIIISRHATEYQAEILVDQNGRKFTAPFPEGVDHKTQYGSDVKAHSVYMSQFQMVPYNLL